jgi:hypothetical protein
METKLNETVATLGLPQLVTGLKIINSSFEDYRTGYIPMHKQTSEWNSHKKTAALTLPEA